jgi:hypothetical protein
MAGRVNGTEDIISCIATGMRLVLVDVIPFGFMGFCAVSVENTLSGVEDK